MDPRTEPDLDGCIHRAGIKAALLKACFAIAVAAAVFWLAWDAINSGRAISPLFVPGGMMIVACLIVLRHEQHWVRPLHTMLRLLPRIRAGELPIEELGQVRGGLARLVPLMQQLLHDLRQHRAQAAELDHELRQRVASRTNALERQIGSLRQQASRDALTNLYNRRLLDALLPQLIDRCAADGSDLTLLMIDVDHFKLLNDTLGHAAGDRLLRDIARLIQSGIRQSDMAFRIGGDEFVIVLPGVSPAAADSQARRLTHLVDELVRPLRLARRPGLSIGRASVLENKPADGAELLRQADHRLYAIKAARRAGDCPTAAVTTLR